MFVIHCTCMQKRAWSSSKSTDLVFSYFFTHLDIRRLFDKPWRSEGSPQNTASSGKPTTLNDLSCGLFVVTLKHIGISNSSFENPGTKNSWLPGWQIFSSNKEHHPFFGLTYQIGVQKTLQNIFISIKIYFRSIHVFQQHYNEKLFELYLVIR